MDKGSDPYTSILRTVGDVGAAQANRGTLQMFLGIVKQTLPLEIDVNGTVQRAADGNLRCNPALINDRNLNFSAKMTSLKGSFETDVTTELVTISNIPISSGDVAAGLSMTLPAPGFAVGDQLIMLTRDQQTFYILCKEVQL